MQKSIKNVKILKSFDNAKKYQKIPKGNNRGKGIQIQTKNVLLRI